MGFNPFSFVSHLIGGIGSHQAAKTQAHKLGWDIDDINKAYGNYYNQVNQGYSPYANLGQQYEQYGQNFRQGLNPYTSMGSDAANQLRNLSTDQGQANFLDNYYKSGAYKAMNQAANENLNAQLIGSGLGTGSVGTNLLANVAPSLGMHALNQRLGLLSGEVGQGLQGQGLGLDSYNLGLQGQQLGLNALDSRFSHLDPTKREMLINALRLPESDARAQQSSSYWQAYANALGSLSMADLPSGSSGI